LSAGVLLYPDEVALIRQRTAEINARIASVAAANGATVLDTHAIFDHIVQNNHGYEVGGGIVVTGSFLTGGIFSADGFHPSNIGYAIVAKEVVQHINDTKGTEFELPDLAHAVFEPDVPAITATGVVDPAAGPFGFSFSMWKDLVRTAAGIPEGVDLDFPTFSKRVTRLLPAR
jgi:hypothetical protein